MERLSDKKDYFASARKARLPSSVLSPYLCLSAPSPVPVLSRRSLSFGSLNLYASRHLYTGNRASERETTCNAHWDRGEIGILDSLHIAMGFADDSMIDEEVLDETKLHSWQLLLRFLHPSRQSEREIMQKGESQRGISPNDPRGSDADLISYYPHLLFESCGEEEINKAWKLYVVRNTGRCLFFSQTLSPCQGDPILFCFIAPNEKGTHAEAVNVDQSSIEPITVTGKPVKLSTIVTLIDEKEKKGFNEILRKK
ncbi:hypothetical protein PRIPAC_86946, partial [Pristionchus pacificus]|uniref:Uncharacterized protein n=1 Tax=Pristionchus pacificus TaxID=54126 RepID=A0A2A6CE58_PRIPA